VSTKQKKGEVHQDHNKNSKPGPAEFDSFRMTNQNRNDVRCYPRRSLVTVFDNTDSCTHYQKCIYPSLYTVVYCSMVYLSMCTVDCAIQIIGSSTDILITMEWVVFHLDATD